MFNEKSRIVENVIAILKRADGQKQVISDEQVVRERLAGLSPRQTLLLVALALEGLKKR